MKHKDWKVFARLKEKIGFVHWHNKWIMDADIGVRKPSTYPPPTAN